MHYDFCVIGAGIVGLATALKLKEAQPDARLLILDKESGPAQHQTGHNSGVIHAGIYYTPGSLKANLCRAGLEATKQFCTDHGIRFDACGKLIVATNEAEGHRIDALYERATANGLSLTQLSAEELAAEEPRIVGTKALLSPATAIVDYVAITMKMAELLRQQGAEFVFGAAVDHIREEIGSVEIGAAGQRWTAGRLVVCGGLQADRLARLAGLPIDFRIVPFRGEYYRLSDAKSDVVKRLIYPAPDPALPFLGIHLTRMIDGSVTVGPNATLGFSREGYAKLSVNLRDMADYVGFGGFWRLMAKSVGTAAHELHGSLFKQAYLKQCRKYCPELQLEDLLPYRAGIRAQAVSADGTLIHDFLIRQTERMTHICNAPSPAATSALPIGALIAQRCLGKAAVSASTT